MNKHLFGILQLTLCATVILQIVSCNIYSSFETESSVQDHLEVAQKCKSSGDLVCATKAYEKLPDGIQKEQKLCTIYLSRAGFKLTHLIDVFKTPNAKVLGVISNLLLPYNTEKGISAADAKKHCNSYQALAATSGSSGEVKFGILLKTLGAFIDCTTRMAKTTVFQATSNSDDSCTTPAPAGTSRVKISTIGGSGGAISVSNPGMCPADAIECAKDILAIDATALHNAEFDDMASALNSIPEDIKATGVPDQVRSGLQQTLSE